MVKDLFIKNNLDDVDYVKSIIRAYEDNRILAKKTNGFMDLEEPLRSMRLYMLGQNSYGSKWQKIIIEQNNWQRVKDSEGRGDFKNKNDAYFEFKISYSSQTDNFSFWQARLWQDLDGYYFKAIDKRVNFTHYDFFLTKQQILEEAGLQGATQTHGTKLVAEKNKFNELTIRLNKSDNDMQYRWFDRYYIKDIKSVIDNIGKANG